MPKPYEIYQPVIGAPEVPKGLPLVVLLTGFTDAGSTVSGLIDHLHETVDLQPLVIFENDALLDYRARRPIIHFSEDHLSAYEPAKLELLLAHDTIGQPFLLLSGYEPDFAWDTFVNAVIELADSWEVSGVSWVHAIAMPVPHTRPIGTTVSGNSSELIATHSVWRPRTQVPATVGHLLEYRMMEQGYSLASFVLLVPHYLADTRFPDSMLIAADRLMDATGLVLSMDAVREASVEYHERVEDQMMRNDELRELLRTLEERYDAYMAGYVGADAEHGFGDAPLTERNLPSADELAAELERYLAAQRPSDDDSRPPAA
jgi:hypothetical protein